jgi:hypothetical protein
MPGAPHEQAARFGVPGLQIEINPLNPSHMSEPLSEGDLNEIREEIFAGRKISAIKLYRQYTRSGLADAKDAVEAMERKLREESPGRFVVEASEGGQEVKSAKNVPGVQVGKGCFGVFVGILLAVALTLIAALWR